MLFTNPTVGALAARCHVGSLSAIRAINARAQPRILLNPRLPVRRRRVLSGLADAALTAGFDSRAHFNRKSKPKPSLHICSAKISDELLCCHGEEVRDFLTRLTSGKYGRYRFHASATLSSGTPSSSVAFSTAFNSVEPDFRCQYTTSA
jgi:hypothetical protein